MITIFRWCIPKFLYSTIKDGTNTTFITSIAVSGNDIYVAGASTDATNKNSAVFWKNGVATRLSDGNQQFGIANSIIVK